MSDEIRQLIAPYLNTWGDSNVGDLARSIRDVLDAPAKHEHVFDGKTMTVDVCSECGAIDDETA